MTQVNEETTKEALDYSLDIFDFMKYLFSYLSKLFHFTLIFLMIYFYETFQ